MPRRQRIGTPVPPHWFKSFNPDLRPLPLRGGKSEGMVPADFDLEELAMGIEVEMEHTREATVALFIAMDHLAEIPDYYTRLARMEEAGKAYWRNR